jgi:branched-chain amino acid transport system substrate-binding protein
MSEPKETATPLTRRSVLGGAGAAAALALSPGFVRFAQAQSSAPIRIGFQCHRTGIGASYGRWYERVTLAAAKRINDAGGINGRPVEIVTEDDGTDPRRGAEVVAKLATQSRCDVVYGTLFSNVVVGSAPTAGELKVPYYVVSEGYHVASGKLNRWCFQPGITDVRSQVTAMAPWIAANLGKRVAMIFPDYAFGHDHRDYFTPAIKRQGGEVVAQIPIPPTESSFTRYFPQIPADAEVLYHVMVGPAVLTFVKEMGEFYGSDHPRLFGFLDSLEGVDLASPGLEFLDGSHFWEGMPRYLQANAGEAEKGYRDAVGLDGNGAAVEDARNVSTASHMFGCWETLFTIKRAMEEAGYQGPQDRSKLVEATEAMTNFPEGIEHPQGDKVFNGRLHQCFGHQNISKVEGGCLNVVHRTAIEDGQYAPEADYTTQAL